MRTLFAILLFLISLAPVTAQAQLPLDENGKVLFYEVVTADSLPKEALYANAMKWLSAQSLTWQDEPTGDKTTYRLITSNSFPVYAKGYISKQLHGTISYQLTIELKDFRYRYYFSDFVFHYYHQDRTYEMVPTGKTKPLEDQKAAGWQKTWESHQAATSKTIAAISAELKTGLKNKVSPTAEEKIAKQVTIKESW